MTYVHGPQSVLAIWSRPLFHIPVHLKIQAEGHVHRPQTLSFFHLWLLLPSLWEARHFHQPHGLLKLSSQSPPCKLNSSYYINFNIHPIIELHPRYTQPGGVTIWKIQSINLIHLFKIFDIR